MTTILNKTYHITTKDETLEQHMYIDSYKDSEIKRTIHVYKFTRDKYEPDFIDAKAILIHKTVDICVERYMHVGKSTEKIYHIYTSPPSTMYERGEKDTDSMFELVRMAILYIVQGIYISKNSFVQAIKVYTVSTTHLKKQRAQHIGGTRKARTKNLTYRYSISLGHKIFLWYQIHIRKVQRYSYTVIDDVSSTGSTLVACKYTLLAYLEHLQKKNPHIKFDVWICSLVH